MPLSSHLPFRALAADLADIALDIPVVEELDIDLELGEYNTSDIARVVVLAAAETVELVYKRVALE